MTNHEILTIRHLPDTQDLSSGLDVPILEDQEDSMVELSTRINSKLHESGAYSVQIITSDQKRTSETARILQKTLQGSGVEQVDIMVENQIRSLDQGTLNLPPDYKPGDDFPPLKLAWGPFWEHVKNGDIFYRFGQAEVKDGLEYHELKNAFIEYGESYAEILIRHLNFIHSLLQNKNENVLNVFIGHSINIRILKEVVEIAKSHTSILNPIRLGTVASLMEEQWDGKRPEFGELETLDISSLTNGLFIDELDQEIEILKAQMVQNGYKF